MIANPKILRALLGEEQREPLTEEFYGPCVNELMASDFFECIFLEDDSYGNAFYLYFIFPRDRRSLRLRDERSPDRYDGLGLGLCLCNWHPVAAYGPISAFEGGADQKIISGRSWLIPENVQTLPALDWADVERSLIDILQRHSIAIMTREEALMPLTALQLPPPTESNITNDTDHVFFGFFNNNY